MERKCTVTLSCSLILDDSQETDNKRKTSVSFVFDTLTTGCQTDFYHASVYSPSEPHISSAFARSDIVITYQQQCNADIVRFG